MATGASITQNSGFSGFSGYSGTNGSGASGFSGYSGTVGTSGFSGYSGTQGISGYSGYSGEAPTGEAIFDQSFDPADCDVNGIELDNDYAVAWVPKHDMVIEGLGFWCTNVGTSDAVYLGVYDPSDNLLAYVSGTSAQTSAGLNIYPLVSGITVSASQRHWLVLKTIEGSMNWGRTTNFGHVTLAKEKFDATESLPSDLTGFFVSTKAPWIGVSGSSI